jgi:hypothetical protein
VKKKKKRTFTYLVRRAGLTLARERDTVAQCRTLSQTPLLPTREHTHTHRWKHKGGEEKADKRKEKAKKKEGEKRRRKRRRKRGKRERIRNFHCKFIITKVHLSLSIN